MLKTIALSETIVRNFFVLASKNATQIEVFHTFIANADFAKIIVFPKENCYFLASEPSKNHPKSMPRRNRKKHRKNLPQNSILASILASQTPPKSTQHRKKSQKIAFEKKLQKKSHATYRTSTQGKHFETLPDHPTIIPMISTSPLICPSSP